MSNSSYLQCVGKSTKTTGELYAEHTLPQGWAWLFSPDELHAGHPRDNAIAAPLVPAKDREITSYLFAEAAVVLPRFVERMRRVGLAVTGKGMTARIYTWLEKHMSKGWWYADTTELEWFEKTKGEGLAELRRMLATAAASSRFAEPSAQSVLLTFGWGTGLSTEELAKKQEKQASRKWDKEQVARTAKAETDAVISAARQAPVDVATLEGRPYSIRESFKVGDQVAHPVFKSGTVTQVMPTTITVDFPTGPQLLAHQRK